MEKLLGSVVIDQPIIEEITREVKNITDLEKHISQHAKEDTTKLLSIILFGAITLEASDIHLEPQEDKTRLRLRLDGILHDISFFESTIYQSLLSRLKLLAKIKLNITEKPQDGRFTVALEKSTIEVRISTLPSEWGESMVLRVLNPRNLKKLEDLGLREDIYAILKKESNKPNGMIMLAGPTGSGKTTTLYAILMNIYNPGVKVITIEDPIEYHLTGISQTQAEPEKGYGFAEGLSSIVRQDPDIILIGEIRDSETAKIAVQASLTGHLVLSTVHANDTAHTIPRLTDLGVALPSIASALKVVVSQRLVRKVCQYCSTMAKASPEELSIMKEGLKRVSLKVVGEKYAKAIESFTDANPHGMIPKIKEKTCDQCNFTGYNGRKGIFEVWVLDEEAEKFILTNPPTSSIRDFLTKKGMITVYQSGLIEVALGVTTLEEVQKVVGEE